MLTNVEICCRDKYDQPKEFVGPLYISAVVTIGNKEKLVRGKMDTTGRVKEIVLFTAEFEGQPVVGAFFVCTEKTTVIECEILERAI